MLPWPEYDVPSFVHQVKLSNQTTCILYEHTTTTTNTTNTTILHNMLLKYIYYTHVTWKQHPVNFKFPSTSPKLRKVSSLSSIKQISYTYITLYTIHDNDNQTISYMFAIWQRNTWPSNALTSHNTVYISTFWKCPSVRL